MLFYNDKVSEDFFANSCNPSLLLILSEFFPIPQCPKLIRAWWTSSTGYMADLVSPIGSWWTPLAGGVASQLSVQ